MRVTSAYCGSNRGCEPPRPSYRRLGVIARGSAILLSGTAAIALSIAQPASAIVINDQLAAMTPGGVGNYYDKNNEYPYVVSLFSAGVPGISLAGSLCTGSLINSRTILTAAHCSPSKCLWNPVHLVQPHRRPWW